MGRGVAGSKRCASPRAPRPLNTLSPPTRPTESTESPEMHGGPRFPGSPSRLETVAPVRVIEVLAGGDYMGDYTSDEINAAIEKGYAIVDLRDAAERLSPRTAVVGGFRFEIGGEPLGVSCAERFWNSRKIFQYEGPDCSNNLSDKPTNTFADRFETKKRGRLVGWNPAGLVPIPRLYQRHDACAYLFAPAYAAQLEAIDPVVTKVLQSRKIAVIDDPCSTATYGTSVAAMLVTMLKNRALALDM